MSPSGKGTELVELFGRLFDHSADGVILGRPDGSVVRVNASACRILGRTEAEVAAVGRSGVIVEDDDFRAWFATRVREGVARGVLRFLRADGSTILCDTLSAVVVGEGGELLTHMTFRDVTAARRDEEALRAREAKLGAFFHSPAVGIAVTEASEAFTEVNDRFCAMLGRTRDEIVGHSWREFTHPGDVDRDAAVIARMMAGEIDSHAWDKRYIRRDGSVLWVLTSVSCSRFPDGRPRYAVAIEQDITARKIAERAVAEKKEELEAILRTAFDGHWVVDMEGRITEVNEAACAMLGYTREEFLSLRVPDLEANENPEDTRRHIEEMRRTGGDRFTTRHRRKDGALVDVEVSTHFVPLHGGRFVCFVRNVTDQRRAEEQLRQSQKMEAVGRLAGGVAHDFNNLLTVMLTSSQFALDASPAGSALRADVEEFRGAAERARVLTQQLLAFGRRQVLVPRTLDLNEVVLDTERLLNRLIGEHVTLRTELAPGLGMVHADPGQVQQVIMNLAINAQDAMPRGGALTIRTSQRERLPPDAAEAPDAGPGPWVVLEIEDTGTGMDAETLAHAFEPFFTTKPLGKGTGLGLSTVFGIVRQSGGVVRVDSEPGKGTRIHVYLPQVSGAATPAVDPERPVAAAAAGSGRTVIVVEDQADVRRATERMLRRAGFDVIGAGSLDEALARVDGHPRLPAVLLTDVRMPGHSGPEVAEALADRVPDIETIYMSGYSGEEIETLGGLPQGSRFLQKPFTAEEFAAKVGEALD